MQIGGHRMYAYRGKTALITGASAGIGEEFVRALAVRGMGTILVARSEDRLRALVAELANRYGVRAEAIAADLGREGAAGRVAAATAERVDSQPPGQQRRLRHLRHI